MSWVEYWNASPTIYVSDRHKEAHYRLVADGILPHLPPDGGSVLDYGCGEALFADRIASACERLYLVDAAPNVVRSIDERFADNDSITALTVPELTTLQSRSIDLIVANSVIQYLDEESLASAVGEWKRLLAPNGSILVADVIPRSVGPATDALALLRFAAREGFVLDASVGLVRTFFSDYRDLRQRLGLSRYEEAEAIEILEAHGLVAHRIATNLGHNQARMSFRVTHPERQRRSRRGVVSEGGIEATGPA